MTTSLPKLLATPLSPASLLRLKGFSITLAARGAAARPALTRLGVILLHMRLPIFLAPDLKLSHLGPLPLWCLVLLLVFVLVRLPPRLLRPHPACLRLLRYAIACVCVQNTSDGRARVTQEYIGRCKNGEPSLVLWTHTHTCNGIPQQEETQKMAARAARAAAEGRISRSPATHGQKCPAPRRQSSRPRPHERCHLGRPETTRKEEQGAEEMKRSCDVIESVSQSQRPVRNDGWI